MKKEGRTKTLAGLDLNGLHDFCSVESEHALDEVREEHCHSLGWRSVAVRIDDPERLSDVIAGPQAERSLYGRGAGYGARVGDKRRRVEIRHVWQKIERGAWEEPDDGDDEADGEENGHTPLHEGNDQVGRRNLSVQPGNGLAPLREPGPEEVRSAAPAAGAQEVAEASSVASEPIRPPGLGETLRAGIAAAAPGAKRAALVVPDIPGLDETAQEWLLRELARAKLGGCTVDLLWRPIAVTLGGLKGTARGKLEAAVNAGEGGRINLAVLIAGTEGVEIQTLRLLRWKGGRLLPERKEHGCRLPWDGDWAERRRVLKRQVEKESGEEAANLLDWQTRTIERMAAGDPTFKPGATHEYAVRDDTGRWRRIRSAKPEPFPDGKLPVEAVGIAREAEYVLLHSPAGERTADSLAHALVSQGIVSDKLVSLEKEAAARGAIECARCLERGEAPYLDHLPRLDLWVQRGDGSMGWSELIPADEAVEAGKTYRTRKPIPFRLLAKTRHLQLKLRKGNEVREKREELSKTPTEEHPVQVYAEQRPASGYATCTVTSESYEPFRRRPIRLVWSDLDEPSRDELAPDLVELKTDARYWRRTKIVERELDRFLAARTERRYSALNQARDALCRALSAIRPPGVMTKDTRRYAVSSSGCLPGRDVIGEAASARIECKLDATLQGLAADLEAFIERPGSESLTVTNLRYLPATWCFTRCPASIQDRLIEAVRTSADGLVLGGDHPLKVNQQSGAVPCYEGIGRTVSDPERIRRVVSHLLERGEVGQSGERLACLSHIVSRRESGAKILLEEKDGVDRAADLGVRTLQELAEGKWDTREDKDKRTLFRYAMLLLGGLCRVRLHDDGALPPDGETAKRAVDALDRAAERKWVRAQKKIAQAAEKIGEYLKGRGTDPKLLERIDPQSG